MIDTRDELNIQQRSIQGIIDIETIIIKVEEIMMIEIVKEEDIQDQDLGIDMIKKEAIDSLRIKEELVERKRSNYKSKDKIISKQQILFQIRDQKISNKELLRKKINNNKKVLCYQQEQEVFIFHHSK
jgi:hypothetical protein